MHTDIQQASSIPGVTNLKAANKGSHTTNGDLNKSPTEKSIKVSTIALFPAPDTDEFRDFDLSKLEDNFEAYDDSSEDTMTDEDYL